MNEKEFDTDYTDEIICLYCGYTLSESYELIKDNDDYECDECGRTFEYC